MPIVRTSNKGQDYVVPPGPWPEPKAKPEDAAASRPKPATEIIAEAQAAVKSVREKSEEFLALAMAAVSFVTVKGLDEEFKAYCREHFSITESPEDDLPF